MQDFLNFGVPNLRTKREEKYPNDGVLTVKALEKKGGGRKIEFNPKAIEMLGIDVENDKNRVAFSFIAGTTKIYIANRTGEDTKQDIKVTKQESISDKRYYEYIKKLLGLDIEGQEDVELKLTNVAGNYNGNNVYEVELLSTVDINTTDVVAEHPMTEAQDAPIADETVIPVDEALVEAPVETVVETDMETTETVEVEVVNDSESEVSNEPIAGTEDFVGNTEEVKETLKPSFVAPKSNNPFAI